MKDQCYLLDLERTIKTGIAFYWKPNKHGYTHNIYEAGLYKDTEAIHIAESDHDDRTIVVPVDVVDKIMN